MRLPLILLTGFLGAGKTTLLNALLKSSQNIGVVVNELGEVGIDGALLGDTAARQIELPGGCVCCVLGDDLDRTLIELVDQNPHLEAVVLETTGVAEPLPIAWALERVEVAKRVRLAAVVTVVDAASFLASRPLSAAVDAQVAYADVIPITKSELVEPEELARVTSAIRTLAPQALVRAADTATHVAWLAELLRDPPVKDVDAEDHVHDASCRHLDNAQERGGHGIDSVWIEVEALVDLEELEDVLGELPSNYVRIKGIVRGIDPRGREGWFVVHRVGMRVSSEPIDQPGLESGRIVALGSRIDRGDLIECVGRATVDRG